MRFPRHRRLNIGHSGEGRRAQRALNLRSRPRAGPAGRPIRRGKEPVPGLTTWRARPFLRSRGGNTNPPSNSARFVAPDSLTLAVGGARAQHAFFLVVAAGAVDRDRQWLSSQNKIRKTTPRKVGLWRRSAMIINHLDSMWLQAHLETQLLGTVRPRGARSLGDSQMAARETKKHKTEEKPVHKVTAAERAALEKYLARDKAKPSVRFKVSKNGSVPQIEFDHPDKLIGSALLMDALATADGDFLNGIVDQIAKASAHGQDIERGLNFMLSVIKGIEPRDQLEAMLAAQMAAVHVATMTFARDLAPVNISAFNKLTRTFAMQNRGTQTLPQRRRAEGHAATGFSRRRRPGDWRQRHTGATRERAGEGSAGEGCDATSDPSRYERRANAKHGQKQGTRPTCSAAQVKQMNGDHKRNTGPMLSSLRCGAKTRSGKPCRSPSVH